MMVVLDTSAASAVMHRLPSALERLARLKPGDIVLTSPVAAEIRFGLERLDPRSRRRRRLDGEYRRLRGLVRWEDWTEEAANEFGRQKARLAERGEIVEDMDIAVGAIACALGASVATLNRRHFSRFEGLAVDDWSSGGPS
jgi:predicted nucleic acid-binding protein